MRPRLTKASARSKGGSGAANEALAFPNGRAPGRLTIRGPSVPGKLGGPIQGRQHVGQLYGKGPGGVQKGAGGYRRQAAGPPKLLLGAPPRGMAIAVVTRRTRCILG